MDLVVVRHAIAKDRDAFARTGKPDDLRPLTPQGRKKMRRVARGLRTLVPRIDVLATSPLTRATQTAEILAKVYDGIRPVTRPELSPGLDRRTIVAWLRDLDSPDTVLIVGHEPDLSDLIGWLLTGKRRGFVRLKKGSACALRFDGPPDAGAAEMRWLLTPAQLRAIGG